ncbi:hypothetical protein [Nonomuraea dietziae]|uniref:hypothetical protein n=1 Tax=Nonomuraea dietziae TaxID=65515 RepID=UPI0031D3B3A8
MSIFGAAVRRALEWRLEPGGKLVAAIETEEYRAAVEYTASCARRASSTRARRASTRIKRKNEFNAGRAAMTYDGMPAFLGAAGYLQTQKKIDPKADPRPMLPVGDRTAALPQQTSPSPPTS